MDSLADGTPLGITQDRVLAAMRLEREMTPGEELLTPDEVRDALGKIEDRIRENRSSDADRPDRTVTAEADPAYRLLADGATSTPPEGVFDDKCYICNDPEFSQMGLPLCQACPACTAKPGPGVGHVPADDIICTDCGYDLQAHYEEKNNAPSPE